MMLKVVTFEPVLLVLRVGIIKDKKVLLEPGFIKGTEELETFAVFALDKSLFELERRDGVHIFLIGKLDGELKTTVLTVKFVALMGKNVFWLGSTTLRI